MILKNRNDSIPNYNKTDITEFLRTMENNSSKEIRLLCNNFDQAKYFIETAQCPTRLTRLEGILSIS